MDPSRIFRNHRGNTCCHPVDYVEPADDHESTTEEFKLISHGTTEIDVVYTNVPAKVESVLKEYEEWLKIDEPRFGMKFVGLDIEYTRHWTKTGEDQEVALLQLAMRKKVLVFHFCRCDLYPIAVLVDFLQNKGIKFTTVDIRGDTRVLARAGIVIPPGHHIDIQDLYQTGKILWDGRIGRDGMALMAAGIIGSSYENMKNALTDDDHDLWEWKPLPEKNLHYAAIDGYVSYELYSHIRIMNLRQRHHQVPAPPPMEVVCPSCKTEARSAKKVEAYSTAKVSWDEDTHNVRVPKRDHELWKRSSANKGSCSKWDEPHPLGAGRSNRGWDAPLGDGYGRSNRSWDAPLGAGYGRSNRRAPPARYYIPNQTLTFEMAPTSRNNKRGKPDDDDAEPAEPAWDSDFPWE